MKKNDKYNKNNETYEKKIHAMEGFQIYNLEPCHSRVSKIFHLVHFRIFEPYRSSKNNIKQLKSIEKTMKHDEKEKKTGKHDEKRENNNEQFWKDWKKTMKNDEKERNNQWKMIKKREQNNAKWWKIGGKKHDEQ